MTDFFTDMRNAVRFDDIIKTVNGLISEYPIASRGLLFLILLMLLTLLFLRIRKRRKSRHGRHEEKEVHRASGNIYDTPPQEIASVEEEKIAARQAPPFMDEDHAMPPMGVMERLKGGLQKTRRSLAGRIENILSERSIADRETLEEIEEALITSDVGVNTTMVLMSKIEGHAAGLASPEDLKEFLKSEMRNLLTRPRQIDTSVKPYVIMVVGVNGVGKTTTIGKLAYRYQSEGKKVLIGAADTFRVAAVEQLEIWAQRSGADIVRHRDNADPAAVAFDAVEAGSSRGSDIVIIDTAGRLQTKVNLMEQLKKIKRSIGKKMDGAPHEVLLVLDATTGQNAISQAKIFHEGIGVTSLALTKLDGTAKGGIVISICNTMKLPLQYIGVGEAIDDLQPFDPEKFIDAIF
ncbi:MAG: signal recognition particle-docking protein FtsY [Desulfosalsimonadaceae bacterium]